MINRFLEKFIDILYQHKQLTEIEKKTIEREKEFIYKNGFDKHFVLAIKILYLLKDNHHQYELDGPLSTSVILYHMGFIKEDPILSVVCEVSEMPLIIKMSYGDEYEKVYKFIEKFLSGDQLLYIYREKKKDIVQRYIPYHGPFVYVFDKQLCQNISLLTDTSGEERRCYLYDYVGCLGTKGMYVELKGII